MRDARERNPYKVLQVPRDADDAAIEAAYDSLFDRYEPQAYAGDAEATRILEELNRARDTLLDPAHRAAVDGQLSRLSGGQSNRPPRSGAAAMARGATTATARPRRQAATGARAATQSRGGYGSSARPRSVARQTSTSPIPFVIGGLALLVAVFVVILFISKNTGGGTGSNGAGGNSANRGAVVARVSDQPIYEQDLNVRYEADKAQQMSEPLIAQIMSEGGITSTRVLDVLKQDALDKLINMEVIQQQAQKENLYPNAQAQNDLINQAKKADVQPGESFEDSLKAHGLNEGQYTRNVITSAVYRVMASKYMPATGSDADKQTAFINWICKTRESYDVKILLTFSTSADNKPCSSGLPSDIDLTGNQIPAPSNQGAPSPEPTGDAPMVPRATP